MYKIYNNHLLFHGCIPLETSGDFQPCKSIKSAMLVKNCSTFFEYHIRESSKNPEIGRTISQLILSGTVEWEVVSFVW